MGLDGRRAPLTVTHPAIAAQWHPTKNGDRGPEQVFQGTSAKVWWLCPIGHEWDDTPNHRTSRGSIDDRAPADAVRGAEPARRCVARQNMV